MYPPNNVTMYLTSSQLRARYGGRSHMWLERLKFNPKFPRPIYIGRCRYWRLAEIEAFERDAVTDPENAAAAAARVANAKAGGRAKAAKARRVA